MQCKTEQAAKWMWIELPSNNCSRSATERTLMDTVTKSISSGTGLATGEDEYASKAHEENNQEVFFQPAETKPKKSFSSR